MKVRPLKNLSAIRITQTQRFAALGLLATSLLTGALVAQACDSVRFKATCLGHYTSASPLVATVTGVGTLIGQFTGTLNEYVAGKAFLLITAANGDKLYCDVTMKPTGGEVVIIGGTGRFEGASGAWESVITGSGPTPQTWTETATGEISRERERDRGDQHRAVPFKATCLGHYTSASPLVATVTGKGTLIGQFTGTLNEYEAGKAWLVITAANGDELYCDVTMTPTGGDVVIIGGTGRFEEASGAWESVITGPGPAPQTWTETATGEINPERDRGRGHQHGD